MNKKNYRHHAGVVLSSFSHPGEKLEKNTLFFFVFIMVSIFYFSKHILS